MTKRILVAEDNKIVRRLVCTFLGSQPGLEVCGEAVDGLEAVKKAEELKPDIILLDLVMPQLNGAQAASVLKDVMPHVPIILFSMYSEELGRAMRSVKGVSAVLSKQEGLDKLLECIQNLPKPS